MRDNGTVPFYFVSIFILCKFLPLFQTQNCFAFAVKVLFSKIWSDKLNIYVNYQEVYGYSSIIVAEQACPVCDKLVFFHLPNI